MQNKIMTYEYNIYWKLRHLIIASTSFTLLSICLYFAEIALYNGVLVFILLGTCHFLSWVYYYLTYPIRFESTSEQLTVYYNHKKPESLRWDKITGIDSLGVHGSKNGFGAPEMEIRCQDKRYYVVKHLNNYTDFENQLERYSSKNCVRGPDNNLEKKNKKNNITAIFGFSIAGIVVFYLQDNIPTLGPIDLAKALIAGCIAGAVSGLLTELGLMGKDKKNA